MACGAGAGGADAAANASRNRSLPALEPRRRGKLHGRKERSALNERNERNGLNEPIVRSATSGQGDLMRSERSRSFRTRRIWTAAWVSTHHSSGRVDLQVSTSGAEPACGRQRNFRRRAGRSDCASDLADFRRRRAIICRVCPACDLRGTRPIRRTRGRRNLFPLGSRTEASAPDECGCGVWAEKKPKSKKKKTAIMAM